MMHGSLKKTFQFTDSRKLPTSYLRPLSPQYLDKVGLHPDYKNVPILSFILVNCFSLLNRIHPGYQPHFSNESQQIFMGEQFLKRLFLENPLLHADNWPFDLQKPNSTCRIPWTQTTFGNLISNDVLQFPQLTSSQINPTALELCGGSHCIEESDSPLTYMSQYMASQQNMSREETIEFVRNFPDDWALEYIKLDGPGTPDCWDTGRLGPWRPEDWWNVVEFGPWRPLTLVRCLIPSSNKYFNLQTRQGGHWAVIGFGTEGSDRLGLRPPYDRIYFFRLV